VKITIFGTLPPLKGNAYYCWLAAKALSEKVFVEFISFKKLYPEKLYPGGVSENSHEFSVSPTDQLKIKRLVTYYNPLSWIRSAFLASSKVIILQWWSLPVGFIWIFVIVILRLRKKVVFLTVHNVFPHEKSFGYRFVFKIVCFFSNRYFVHTEINKKQLVDSFNISKSKIHIVSMGIHDLYLDSENISKQESRARLNIDKNIKMVLLFGNIRDYKGVKEFLEAASLLKQMMGNFLFVIAGEKWIDWKDYDNFIKDNQLEGLVKTYLKYIPMREVKYFFTACDLVVLPYRHFDAQSGVGNIALAFHKALLVTRVGGLTDLVKDERAVIERLNAVDLASKIKEVLQDEALNVKLAKDSKELSQYYSWNRFADETISAIEKLNS